MEAGTLASGKKNAARLGAHIVFIDESGFLLIPCLLRTWAPRGQTPVHRHRYRRDKLSVISGIAVSPKRHRLTLYYRLHLDNIRQKEVCHFLAELLRHVRGPIIVLLDNSRTHKGEPIRTLCQRHPRLRIEYFAAYAPQLNPDEGVWSLAKRDLANGRPDDLFDLIDDVSGALDRIAASPVKLRGCITHSELPTLLS